MNKLRNNFIDRIVIFHMMKVSKSWVLRAPKTAVWRHKFMYRQREGQKNNTVWLKG